MATYDIVWSNPASQPSLVGGVDAGQCDAPFKFPYPDEVETFKNRVLLVADSTDASVKACQNLPLEERASWELFITSFRAFANTPTPMFGSYGIWVETCGYSHVLDAWRVKIKQYCALVGPEDISQGGALNVLKWVASAAIVVAIAGVAIVYAPTILSFVPKGKS